MRGDEPLSVRLPHLLPLLPTNVRQDTRRPLMYPTKARHSTTTPTLTPPAAIALVPDTQSLPFVRIHASTDIRGRGSSAGVRWLVSHVTGSPEPAPAYAASPMQRRNTKHKVETPKERSNCPTDVRSTQRMAERDSRRSKDPMQGQKKTQRGPNASTDG